MNITFGAANASGELVAKIVTGGRMLAMLEVGVGNTATYTLQVESPLGTFISSDVTFTASGLESIWTPIGTQVRLLASAGVVKVKGFWMIPLTSSKG